MTLGTYVWQDGKKYKGEWVNSKMHGYGELTWNKYQNYKGEFKNGKRSGNGEYFLKVLNTEGKHDQETITYKGTFGENKYLGTMETEKGKQKINWVNGIFIKTAQ